MDYYKDLDEYRLFRFLIETYHPGIIEKIISNEKFLSICNGILKSERNILFYTLFNKLLSKLSADDYQKLMDKLQEAPNKHPKEDEIISLLSSIDADGVIIEIVLDQGIDDYINHDIMNNLDNSIVPNNSKCILAFHLFEKYKLIENTQYNQLRSDMKDKRDTQAKYNKKKFERMNGKDVDKEIKVLETDLESKNEMIVHQKRSLNNVENLIDKIQLLLYESRFELSIFDYNKILFISIYFSISFLIFYKKTYKSDYKFDNLKKYIKKLLTKSSHEFKNTAYYFHCKAYFKTILSDFQKEEEILLVIKKDGLRKNLGMTFKDKVLNPGEKDRVHNVYPIGLANDHGIRPGDYIKEVYGDNPDALEKYDLNDVGVPSHLRVIERNLRLSSQEQNLGELNILFARESSEDSEESHDKEEIISLYHAAIEKTNNLQHIQLITKDELDFHELDKTDEFRNRYLLSLLDTE